jgi:hypothetical protein
MGAVWVTARSASRRIGSGPAFLARWVLPAETTCGGLHADPSTAARRDPAGVSAGLSRNSTHAGDHRSARSQVSSSPTNMPGATGRTSRRTRALGLTYMPNRGRHGRYTTRPFPYGYAAPHGRIQDRAGNCVPVPARRQTNRVLLHDSDVVMYDAWWPHLDGWGLADLEAIKHQRISYYVTTVSTVLEKATYQRSDPLSADERAVHRPDLPFAAVHDAMITWSSAYTGRLTEARSELNTSQIYLLPFGPGGGTKAGFGSSRTTAPPSRPRSCSARHRSPRPGTSAM